MKLYAIVSNVSGLYWNDKKGTWTCWHLDDDVWYTKEELEQRQEKYKELMPLDETIIEKEIEG